MPMPVRTLTYALTLLLLSACGGGGGGGVEGPAVPGVTLLGLLQANLQGASEVPVVDPSARATAFVELRSDGQLSFAVTGQSGWVGSVNGLHIHAGAAGVNGGIVVDLLSDGATFDVATRTVSDTFAISAALAAQIVAAPGSFYVNVHTTGAAAGLARGQLAAYVPAEWHAVPDDSEEIPSNASGAHGATSLHVTTERALQWVAALTSPPVGAITMAHVHVGGLGVTGPVFVDLDPASATADAAAGTLTGSVPCSLSALSRIAFAPELFYVNLHTAGFPNGICRGQLAGDEVEMWAALRGDKEVPVVDAAARGGVTLELTRSTAGRVILAVPIPQGIGSITMAHVHGGAAGVNGPILASLMDGADFDIGVGSGSAEGSITYTQALYARLLANPAAFYVNLHSVAAPNGLARGQLTQAPQSLAATLSGANEVLPPATPTNSGRARVQLTAVHALSFTIDMTAPAASLVIGAHIHDGVAGTRGPILIDFMHDPLVNGDTMTGEATFTGRTFARLLANAAAFYVGVHTAAEPDGAARGQLLLLDADSPPAGLAYADHPVIYFTGGPIAPNVPDSIGGAVTSYSVAPALPAGLSLNTSSGVISGSPTAVTPAADYVVTATNDAGSTPATVNIEVKVGAPTSIAYTSPVIYLVGTQIGDNVPQHTGGAPDDWQISPSLPAGLSIDQSNGTISGTATASAAAQDYTVTASNAAGTIPGTVNIRVDATLEPPIVSYDTPKTYKTGHEIAPNTPSNTGGPAASWSISPSLPAGLEFSTSTGVISGTPTVKVTATDYTVTATNAAGSDPTVVNITVVLGEPKELSYDNAYGIGYVSGGTFTTMNASCGGGGELTYSISPALPPGISIDTSNGTISGSPTQTSGQTTYTVTATNTAGSTTTDVVITILQ